MKKFQYDSIKLEVFRNIFQSVCDEMGNVIRLSAFSPNIKERNDFSCALFLKNGESFAFGSHIPVHLGSMPLSVKNAIENYEFSEGDVIILNDPFSGGTHLPDITMVSPFFYKNSMQFFVSCRAHHSDIGGSQPGSMPLASDIYQEGLIIPPVKLYRKGRLNRDILNIILANTRTPLEREGDINAQIAAINRGKQRLKSIMDYYGADAINWYANGVIEYSEEIFNAIIKDIPDGIYSFTDYMDDDGFSSRNIKISLDIKIVGFNILFDFSKSSPSVQGGINANEAIVYSSVMFCLISAFKEQIPINSGIMRSVRISLSPDSIVNAKKPAAVAGGNVETSQRIVDVILGALSSCRSLEIPSASQGTMNNITFGGSDSSGSFFTYYETIGGGCGAFTLYNGASGVHSHMTNSLNTPVEVLESNIPVRITRYLLRKNSGGKGKYIGGDGIIREYQCLKDISVSILSDRRELPPYGLKGGGPGQKGANYLKRDKKIIPLRSKINFRALKSDNIIIETPGGGGYGIKKKGGRKKK